MQRQDQSIYTLLADALHDSTELARKELALFKAEMAQNARNLAIALGIFVAAAVFAIISVSLLVEAVVEWLATMLGSEALAALIVAVLMAAVAGGLAMYGRSKLSASALTPDRTVRNVQRDAAALTHAAAGRQQSIAA
jgi:hypothetical protein